MSDEARSTKHPTSARSTASAPDVEAHPTPDVSLHSADVTPPVPQSAVAGQARWGLAAATGSLLVAYVLTLSVMWAEVFGFGGAFSLQVMPVLPVAAALLVWAGLAGAGVLSAVRIWRLARWSKVDPDNAPISPVVARIVSMTIWAVTGLGAVVAGLAVLL